MRVVGGKLGADKKLGTYVSTVVPSGVADMAGIVEGRFSHTYKYYFKISRVRTSRLYYSPQCHRLNGKQKRRHAGLFGLPRHSYVAATTRGKRVPACVLRNIV